MAAFNVVDLGTGDRVETGLVELTRMEGKVVAKGERLVLAGCFLGRGVGLGGLWRGVGFKVVEY